MGRGAVSEPVAALGYDPHPEIDRYAGNPLPEMDDPISWTEQRAYIAGYVWTQGPAWSVLRNANEYLWSVMSNASVDDVRFTIRDIERSRWLRALREAKPGKIGGGAYRLFSILFETGPRTLRDGLAGRMSPDRREAETGENGRGTLVARTPFPRGRGPPRARAGPRASATR